MSPGLIVTFDTVSLWEFCHKILKLPLELCSWWTVLHKYIIDMEFLVELEIISSIYIFGSDRSPRRGNVGSQCVCLCTLCNRALRKALKEFLQHSKESLGVLG